MKINVSFVYKFVLILMIHYQLIYQSYWRIFVSFIVGKVDWNKHFFPSFFIPKKQETEVKKGNLLSGILFSYKLFQCSDNALHCIALHVSISTRNSILYVNTNMQRIQIFFLVQHVYRTRFDVVWEIDALQVKIGVKISTTFFFQRKCLRIWHYEKEFFGTRIW